MFMQIQDKRPASFAKGLKRCDLWILTGLFDRHLNIMHVLKDLYARRDAEETTIHYPGKCPATL